MAQRSRITLVALLLAAIVIRIWVTPLACFSGDEAHSWSTAREMATFRAAPAFGPPITGTEARCPGGLFYWIIALPQLLGDSPIWGSIFVALLHAGLGLLLFDAASRARGTRAGLIVVALFAFAPWDVLYSDRIWSANIFPVLTTIALYAAVRCESSRVHQGVLVFVSLVLPQVHLSAPVVWAACAVILVLRRPQQIAWKMVLLGLLAVFVAYLPPLVSELSSGFQNTKLIFSKSGGKEMMSDLAWTPVRVVIQAVLFGSSDIAYHYARGYWTAQFSEMSAYFSAAGWRAAFQSKGALRATLDVSSIVLSLSAWSLQLFAFAKRMRRSEKGPLELEWVWTVGICAGLTFSAILLVLAKKIYFPHYVNAVVPLVLLPITFAIDRAFDHPRLRNVTAALVGLSMTAMVWSVVDYYLTIPRLNGLSATLEMVKYVGREGASGLKFDHFDNTYAWQTVARTYREPLRINSGAPVQFRVHNGAKHLGPVPDNGRLFGAVLVERVERVSRAHGALVRGIDHPRDFIVLAEPPSGETTPCVYENTESKRCSYGKQGWQHFGPESVEVGGLPELLLFMHPIEHGVVRATMSIPANTTRAIVRYALTDDATRSDNKTPVHLTIKHGEAMLAERDVINVLGLQTFETPIAKVAPLVIEIRTEKEGARVFVFDVELYGDEPATP